MKKFLILLTIVMSSLECTAQSTKNPAIYDTIPCTMDCVKKIVEVPNASGTNTRLYAAFESSQFSDLIPISKTVYNYIMTCNQNGLTPKIGIKLKNGEVSSIVKLKQKIRHAKR